MCGEILSLGPPTEPPFRQPLLAQPVALAIIHEHFEGGPPAVAEQEEAAAERIGLQHCFAYPGKAVYPFSEVDRIDRHQDPHLGRDLDHLLQNSRTSSTTLQLPVIFIRSPGRSISMMYWTLERPANSMKAVESGTWRPLARVFKSL